MSVYIIKSTLTNEFVRSIYSALVAWEAKKIIGLDNDLQEGCQTGYITCLGDMFGESEDEKMRMAFSLGETWLQVVETITRQQQLADVIHLLHDRYKNNHVGLDSQDFDLLTDTVDKVVKSWLIENMEVARRAIQNI